MSAIGSAAIGHGCPIVGGSGHLASADVATLAGSLNEALATNPFDGLDGHRLHNRSAEGLLSSAIDMGSPAKLRPRGVE